MKPRICRCLPITSFVCCEEFLHLVQGHHVLGWPALNATSRNSSVLVNLSSVIYSGCPWITLDNSKESNYKYANECIFINGMDITFAGYASLFLSNVM